MAQIKIKGKREGDKISESEDFLRFDDLSMNLRTHEVWLCGKGVKLTPTEFEILRILMLRNGEPVRAEEISRCLWPDECCTGSGSISVHISNLRAKLKTGADGPKYIQTIWRTGYKIAK